MYVFFLFKASNSQSKKSKIRRNKQNSVKQVNEKQQQNHYFNHAIENELNCCQSVNLIAKTIKKECLNEGNNIQNEENKENSELNSQNANNSNITDVTNFAPAFNSSFEGQYTINNDEQCEKNTPSCSYSNSNVENENNVLSPVVIPDLTCDIPNTKIKLEEYTFQNILFKKYFEVIEYNPDDLNINVLCRICTQPKYIKGSKKATSNFVRHLKVCVLILLLNYIYLSRFAF